MTGEGVRVTDEGVVGKCGGEHETQKREWDAVAEGREGAGPDRASSPESRGNTRRQRPQNRGHNRRHKPLNRRHNRRHCG